jgi:hypothetical protein
MNWDDGMKESVAVVGSGMSGLSCAYRLARSGFRVKVFEKDVLAGGRAPKAIRTVSKTDTNMISLLEDIGYTNFEEITLDKLGYFGNGKTMSFSKFKPMIFMENELSLFYRFMRRIAGRAIHIDLKELNSFQRYINSLDFSLERKNAELEKLHEISMHEWMSNYSESMINNIFMPMLQIRFETEFKKMSAKDGVHQIRKSLDIARKGGYIIKGGPFAVTQDIIKYLRDMKNEMVFLSEVTGIEENAKGFEVVYKQSEEPSGIKKEGSEIWGRILKMVHSASENFKYVVLALQLPASSKILGRDFGVPYLETKSIYTKGVLKKGWEFVAGPDYDSNFRVLFTLLTREEQCIYPISVRSEVTNIETLFKNGEDVPMAMPRIMPKTEIPSLEYEIENVFLCGDFYHYPCLETAVKTGFMVADKIISKKR